VVAAPALVSIQAGHGEVFGLTATGEMWVHNDQTGWQDSHGAVNTITVGTDAAGRDEVWALVSNGTVWSYAQGVWTNTNGRLASIQAGHGEVFGLTAAGELWVYNDQTGWLDSQGAVNTISVGTDAAGRDEVWALDSNGTVWSYDQNVWNNTNGKLASIQAGHGEVFGLTAAGELWVYNDQTGWLDSQGLVVAFSVGMDAAGRDEVYVLDGNSTLWTYDQNVWTNTQVTLASIQAGHGEVFGLMATGTMGVYLDQSGLTNTTGLAKSISIGTDASGVDEVFLLAADGSLQVYHQGALSRL
jgi:hypothetical protein